MPVLLATLRLVVFSIPLVATGLNASAETQAKKPFTLSPQCQKQMAQLAMQTGMEAQTLMTATPNFTFARENLASIDKKLQELAASSNLRAQETYKQLSREDQNKLDQLVGKWAQTLRDEAQLRRDLSRLQNKAFGSLVDTSGDQNLYLSASGKIEIGRSKNDPARPRGNAEGLRAEMARLENQAQTLSALKSRIQDEVAALLPQNTQKTTPDQNHIELSIQRRTWQDKLKYHSVGNHQNLGSLLSADGKELVVLIDADGRVYSAAVNTPNQFTHKFELDSDCQVQRASVRDSRLPDIDICPSGDPSRPTTAKAVIDHLQSAICYHSTASSFPTTSEPLSPAQAFFNGKKMAEEILQTKDHMMMASQIVVNTSQKKNAVVCISDEEQKALNQEAPLIAATCNIKRKGGSNGAHNKKYEFFHRK